MGNDDSTGDVLSDYCTLCVEAGRIESELEREVSLSKGLIAAGVCEANSPETHNNSDYMLGRCYRLKELYGLIITAQGQLTQSGQTPPGGFGEFKPRYTPNDIDGVVGFITATLRT